MPSAVLIGASDVMAALRERTRASGDALCFADSEPLQALKAITTHRPPLVVLERLFAATPRGAALINRIKSDPSLSHAEVRVVSHSGDYVRTVSAPAPVAMAAAVAAGEADAGAPRAIGCARAWRRCSTVARPSSSICRSSAHRPSAPGR